MNWTKNEVELLKKHFPIMDDAILARYLKKSPNALRIKASRLLIVKESTLIRKNLQISKVQEQVIIGGLLGDLSSRIKSTNKHANLEGGHCVAQKEYLLWKKDILGNLTWSIRKTKINTYLYQSRSYAVLDKYHELFYKTGKKKVSPDILELIDNFGVLIWYLDDGYRRKDGEIILHTNGFSYEEQILMKEWFSNKYNIITRIGKHTDDKRHPGKVWYYLVFSVNNAKKLLSLFDKFSIPSCMQYKLEKSHSTKKLRSNDTSLILGEKRAERKEMNYATHTNIQAKGCASAV